MFAVADQVFERMMAPPPVIDCFDCSIPIDQPLAEGVWHTQDP